MVKVNEDDARNARYSATVAEVAHRSATDAQISEREDSGVQTLRVDHFYARRALILVSQFSGGGLVVIYGGTISVDPMPGGGTSFRIELQDVSTAYQRRVQARFSKRSPYKSSPPAAD